jgi:hypothetical protein
MTFWVTWVVIRRLSTHFRKAADGTIRFGGEEIRRQSALRFSIDPCSNQKRHVT